MNRYDILKTYFGYDVFRFGQEEVIEAILNGQDVMAIMPTGAGKSICYQVPAMILPGITIVVSPLISLMQDQVKSLNQVGIHAAYINSSLTQTQINKALSLASQGVYKIIYVAPERLMSYEFLNFASSSIISMVTVDEAHCISQWGQDFRPSYQKITEFIAMLQNRPIVSAFTATATNEVKQDIKCSLKLIDPYEISTGFDRGNLFYSVEHTRKKIEYIFDYLEKNPSESGIIYCATRKNVEKVYEELIKRGISTGKYHAGMGSLERKNNQDNFVFDRTRIIVATNAFGMGIDKSNVRFVIHYNMPQSMENYYQEAGRAGRDGEEAQCILLYSSQDVVINRMLLDRKDFSEVSAEDQEMIRERDMKRLQVMERYCNSMECNRNSILNYFGEKTEQPCEHCGNCYRDFQEKDMTDAAKTMINCVYESKGRYGAAVIIGTLLGANRARLKELHTNQFKTYGKLKNYTEYELKNLMNQLLVEGYLQQSDDKWRVLRLSDKIRLLKKESVRVIVKYCEEKKLTTQNGEAGKRRSNRYSNIRSDVLTSEGVSLFEQLRTLRTTIAKEEGIPPYIVFTDKTLVDMCVRLPHDLESFLQVSGVGQNKKEKYGQRFLNAISEYVMLHPQAIFSIADNSIDNAINNTINNTNNTCVNTTDNSNENNSGSDKLAFFLTQDEADNFLYAETYYIKDIWRALNEIRNIESVKALPIRNISLWLLEEGYITEQKEGKYNHKIPTDKGIAAGVCVEERKSENGMVYPVLKYKEKIQHLIVDHFTNGTRDNSSKFI